MNYLKKNNYSFYQMLNVLLMQKNSVKDKLLWILLKGLWIKKW